MKKTCFIILAILGLLLLGDRVGIVGFRYPRWVENDSLRDPISVIGVDGMMVTLEDGRVLELEMDPPEVTWKDFFVSGKKVDIEDDGDGEALLYANMPRVRCGTPWARLIRIPLFPDDVNCNSRRIIAFGSFELPEFQSDPADGEGIHSR